MARWEPDAKGRLQQAALELLSEHGYEGTTVAQIAERAGVTERTFYRHFGDKRDVLFDRAGMLEELIVGSTREAPLDASPLAAAIAALAATSEMFEERRAFARVRHGVIWASDELRERELVKLSHLAGAIAEVLVERGVDPESAALAGEVGLGVFHAAFGAWVADDGGRTLGEIIEAYAAELAAYRPRSVTAG